MIMKKKYQFIVDLINKGLFDIALIELKEALKTDEDNLKLLEMLAQVHFQLNNKDLSGQVIERAFKLNNTDASVAFSAGVIFSGLGEKDKACTFLKQAVFLSPNNTHFLNAYGLSLFELKQFELAKEAYRKTLDLDANHINALHNLAWILQEERNWVEALPIFQRYFQLVTGDGIMWYKYATVLDHFCAVDMAIEAYKRALGSDEVFNLAYNNLLLDLNYFVESKSGLILEYSRLFNNRLNNVYGQPIVLSRPSKRNKKRLGFISGDFKRHAVLYFLMPLMRNIDTSQWDIYLYNTEKKERKCVLRDELCSIAYCWREIGYLDVSSAQSLIRQDELDIIIDLSGHTAANRLDVLHGRVAYKQVTWLGYPNTTGLQAMDYRIGDSIADKYGDRFYSEKIINISGAFLCYGTPDVIVDLDVKLEYKPQEGRIVFASFNSAKKITKDVIRVWSNILLACDEAVLVLKSPLLYTDLARQRILNQFKCFGVDVGRIQCLPGMSDLAEHFALYNQVDVALDSFPYNGTTTTFEALWMGVPVITMRGDTHVSRVGVSILTHLGYDEWIADSEDDYVAKAIALGRDKLNLALLHGGNLRNTLLNSRLCDGNSFAMNFQNLLDKIWNN